MKARAAIVAKKELMQLLVNASGQYLEKTDPQCETVTSEIIKQYNIMLDQACSIISQNALVQSKRPA